MLRPDQRRVFDDLLDDLVAGLPDHLLNLLEEVPLVVEDEPSDLLLDEMDIDRSVTDLCGLHSGIPLTKRSVEHSGTLPDRMMLFRGPIMRVAGYKRRRLSRASTGSGVEALREQIRITLLHEIGHHFGLDEDDLTALGYG